MATRKPSKASEAARRLSGRREAPPPAIDVRAKTAELTGREPPRAQLDLHDDNVLGAVVRALKHNDARVVAGAAITLGRAGRVEVVPNLLEAFETDDEKIASAVAWALGQLGDARALPWLSAAARADVATAAALEALGQIGDVEALSTLRDALSDERPDVRAHAARAIGRLDFSGHASAARRAIDATQALRALHDDESRKVRLCAAVARYALGERNASERVRSELQATEAP